MSLIQLKKVSKTYYIGGKISVPALKEISLIVDEGEFLAIMGPSGSGKSTLLSILGLLDKITSGEYFLFGQEVSKFDEEYYAYLRNQFFGFVFQTFNLLPRLSVVENVFLPFIYSSEVSTSKKDKVLNLLKEIGLEGRLKHKPNEISGGQQQRVALVRALANEPMVILADEPTGNLDSKSAYEIMNLFEGLNQKGHTIIMVTHEKELAERASRIVCLRDGQVISDERTKKIFSLPVSSKKKQIKKRSFFSFLSFKNYVYEAFLSLITNKLRSLLSILGILIGVSAVITMLALGSGAKRKMEEQFSALGTNVLMVRPSFRSGGIALGTEGASRLSLDNIEAIKKFDAVEFVVPYVIGRAQVVASGKNWNTNITGTTTDFLNLRNLVLSSGRFFNESEDLGRSKVAILGRTVARELFGETEPLGQTIRINKVSFKIIGILPKQGALGFRDQDDQIIIPLRTAMYRLLGRDYINYFEVKVKTGTDTEVFSKKIIDEILRVKRLPESQRQSFDVMDIAQVQETASAVIKTLSVLLGAVASISLLVGGIGIMNIMLVMVMERTHEIGLRKALGAQKKDILFQFLVESVVICLFGGFLGIIFGIFISVILSTFAKWVIYISSASIILSFTFSVLVGLIFGLWPALRAAKLMPVEALRYE